MNEHGDDDYRPAGAGDAPPRFVVDCMLGKLAKWLRILGYDAAYDPAADDPEIVERSNDQGRIILTRDTRLVERRRARNFLLIESEIPAEQLRQVVTTLGLRIDEALILSRCLPCNEPTAPVDRTDVRERVPPFVHRTQTVFRRCPACDRIYWGATHSADIRRRIERILGRRG